MTDDPTVNAAVVTATCPDCGDLAHPTATCCDSCGTHLYPGNTTAPAREPLDEDSVQGQKETIMAAPIGCTCGGNRVCTACVLAEYDGDVFAVAAENGLRLIHDALDRSNVVDLHSHSMRAPRAEL